MAKEYPVALPKDTVLAGQYVIDKVLGQGGFGITYKALDHKTKKYVAIKEYFPDTMVTRESTTVVPFTGERGEIYSYGKECFLQEAQTLVKFIGSENVVRILSYFEENGTAYFVMEYIEGKSFDEYIKEKGGRVSFDEAYAILGPVIDALAEVHSKGIIHRDVTPDNIYITNDGKIKLIDFGAARYSIGDRSQSLDVVLKHGFAPKEQYTRRGKQGPYTDVYSLAASFYYAITGKRPPDSIDRLEEDELIPPSARGIKIGRIAEQAILHALNVQPKDRFQTMKEFKNAMTSSVEYDDMEQKAATGYLTRSDRPDYMKSEAPKQAPAPQPITPRPEATPKPAAATPEPAAAKPEAPKLDRFGDPIADATKGSNGGGTFPDNIVSFIKANKILCACILAGVVVVIVGICIAAGVKKKGRSDTTHNTVTTESTAKATTEATIKATTEATTKATTEATTKATTEATTEATTQKRDVKTPNGNSADAVFNIYSTDGWFNIDESALGMSYDDLDAMFGLPALTDWDYSIEDLEYCDFNYSGKKFALFFKSKKLVAARYETIGSEIDYGMCRTVINYGGYPDTGIQERTGEYTQFDFESPGGNVYTVFTNYYDDVCHITQEYSTRKYITRDFTSKDIEGFEVPISLSTFEDSDYYDE